MTDLQHYISGYFGVVGDQVDAVAECFAEESLAKGAFHTEAGSYHTRLSFVRSGFLRVWRETPEKDVTQWISSHGEFATELGALLFQQPSRMHIQALTDCELYTISQADYAGLANRIPGWTKLEHLFMGKCFMTIEDRVFGFLSMTAEERYVALLEHKPELFQHVPLQHIASMLGMTPETCSRIRRKLVS